MDWRWLAWQIHGGETWRQTAVRYDALLESQWYSREQLKAIQAEKLEQMLRYALDTVPLYKQLGLPPRLDAFPVLDRMAIRREYQRLPANPAPPGKIYNWQSAGSSGEPTGVRVDSQAQAWRRACMLRGDAWGTTLKPTDRQAWLWAVDRDASEHGSWRASLYRWVYNRYVFSRVEFDRARAVTLNAQLLRLRPRVLIGYASAVEAYSQFARAAGLTPPRLDKVILTSETCLDQAQMEMQDFFGCTVVDRYGAAELGPIAHRCEYRNWHLHTENLVLEVKRDDGSIADEGYGSLLCTSLSNRALPLIRYEIGDMLDLTPVECPCGRGLQTFRAIDGRLAERLSCPGGKWVSPFAFAIPLRRMPFNKFRIVQESEKLIVCLVQGFEEISPELRAQVHELFDRHLGGDMRLEIHVVDHIPVLSNGKDPIVINKVYRRAMGMPVPPEQ